MIPNINRRTVVLTCNGVPAVLHLENMVITPNDSPIRPEYKIETALVSSNAAGPVAFLPRVIRLEFTSPDDTFAHSALFHMGEDSAYTLKTTASYGDVTPLRPISGMKYPPAVEGLGGAYDAYKGLLLPRQLFASPTVKVAASSFGQCIKIEDNNNVIVLVSISATTYHYRTISDSQ
jgi:hypothetical protein